MDDVKKQLELGADVNQSDTDGETPVYVAAQNGHEAVVQQLVAADAALNQSNNNGATPLFMAAQKGHEAVVQQLVAAGAAVNQARNTDGVTSPGA